MSCWDCIYLAAALGSDDPQRECLDCEEGSNFMMAFDVRDGLPEQCSGCENGGASLYEEPCLPCMLKIIEENQ